jgi:hypothetical protein
MKKSEIIHLIKTPIKNVMERYGKDEISLTFASDIIAVAIYNYDNKVTTDDDISNKNNPLAIIDPSIASCALFTTVDECIIKFKDNNELEKYDSSELEKIKKANNLYRFDKEYINSINGPVVDLPEDKCDPSVDVYTVRDNDGPIIATTDNIDAAMNISNGKKGSTITNSRGEIVGKKTNLSKDGSATVLSYSFSAGTKVTLENVNLYYKFKSTVPDRAVSGEYYFWDGKVVNGRIAICKAAEVCGVETAITGFIRVSDINK